MFVLKPIGVVRVGVGDDVVRDSIEGVEGVVEVYPEYVEGLTGVEGFSHIILIAYLHRTREEHRRVLRIKHRKWARLGVDIGDLPEIGVFASDSPHRPNPLALTIVELVKRVDNKLYVKGLDLFDGTPVLDIKPYDHSRVVKKFRVPWWHRVLEDRIREKFGREAPV